MRFKISNRFKPGDVLRVQASNRIEDVKFVCDWFGIDPETSVLVTPGMLLNIPICLQQALSVCWFFLQIICLKIGILKVRLLLSEYLDITAVPNRYFFQVLAHFATNPLEAERLKEFASNQVSWIYLYCYLGDWHIILIQEERYSYCNRPRRTCIEVFGVSFSL